MVYSWLWNFGLADSEQAPIAGEGYLGNPLTRTNVLRQNNSPNGIFADMETQQKELIHPPGGSEKFSHPAFR